MCFWVCSGADAYCNGGREAEVDRSVVDGDPDGRSRGADVGDGKSGTDRDSVSGEVAEDVGRAIRDAQHLHGGAGFGLVESLAVIGRDPSVRVGDRGSVGVVGGVPECGVHAVQYEVGNGVLQVVRLVVDLVPGQL